MDRVEHQLDVRRIDRSHHLDPVVGAAELVLDAQNVRPVADGDDQIVPVLGEDEVVLILDVKIGDVAAELDDIVDRYAKAAPVLLLSPGQPYTNLLPLMATREISANASCKKV